MTPSSTPTLAQQQQQQHMMGNNNGGNQQFSWFAKPTAQTQIQSALALCSSWSSVRDTTGYRNSLVNGVVGCCQSCLHHLGVSAREALAEVDMLHPVRLIQQPQTLHRSVCLQCSLQGQHASQPGRRHAYTADQQSIQLGGLVSC